MTSNDKAIAIFNFVFSLDRWDQLCKTAALGPDRPYVVVICDLSDSKGVGKFVAAHLNPQHFPQRKVGEDLWTFLCPLKSWQEFRQSAVGAVDTFVGPKDGQRFTVISGGSCITGSVTELPSSIANVAADPLGKRLWIAMPIGHGKIPVT